MNKTTYRPRNEFVLVRIVQKGKSKGGIHIPDVASESKSFRVEAIGDGVADLEVGDKVIICAMPGEGMYFPVPDENELILVKQEFLAAVAEEPVSG